jgi:hypothetical protein
MASSQQLNVVQKENDQIIDGDAAEVWPEFGSRIQAIATTVFIISVIESLQGVCQRNSPTPLQ